MADVVWGVMWMMAALLTGTGWIIYYILRLAYIETRDGETTVTYPVIGTVTPASRGEAPPELEPSRTATATA